MKVWVEKIKNKYFKADKSTKATIVYYLYLFFMNGRFSRGLLVIYCMTFDISLFEFGLLQSLYSFSKMIFEIPSGIISDFFKRKYILVLGSLLSAFSSLMYFIGVFISSEFIFIWLMCAFVLDAFSFSLISGTDQAILYDYLKGCGLECKFLNRISTGQVISLIILSAATILGGKFAENLISYTFLVQSVFFSMAAIVIIFFPNLLTLTNSKKKEHISMISQFLQSNKFILNNKVLLSLIIVYSLIEANVNSIYIYIQGYFDSLNISLEFITMIIGISTFVSVLGAFLSRYLKNVSFKTFLRIIYVLFSLGLITLNLSNLGVLILGFYVINILLDISYPYCFARINDLISSDKRATIISTVNMTVGLISLMFYPIYGLLIDVYDYQISFIFIGGMSILLLIIISSKYFKEL